MRINLLVTLILAVFPAVLHGQLIVGNDQPGDASIYYIDVLTGTAAPL